MRAFGKLQEIGTLFPQTFGHERGTFFTTCGQEIAREMARAFFGRALGEGLVQSFAVDDIGFCATCCQVFQRLQVWFRQHRCALKVEAVRRCARADVE